MKAKIYYLTIVLLVNISAFGQTPDWVWAKEAGGTSDDYARSVATDDSGNVYLTGSFSSPSITFGTTNLLNAGSIDMYIVKYDRSGNVLWAKSAGNTSDDIPRSIAIDENGNVYVTGDFDGLSITFGTTTITNKGSITSDVFIVKYDSNGNTLWAKSFGGYACEFSSGIDVDSNGIYVTGEFYSTDITCGTSTITNEGYYDMFIVKYDTNGNSIWTKSAGSTADDYGESIAIDNNGDIYISGSFGSPTITFGTTTLTNTATDNSADIFIVKYDSSGNIIWAKSAGGSDSDTGLDITTDYSGNIYVTGSFWSPLLTIGTTTLTNIGVTDIFIAKYDANGNPIWAKSAGGTVFTSGVITDSNGDVYLTGNFDNLFTDVTFGTSTLTCNGNNDIFIVKYDSEGNIIWAKNFGGTDTEVPWSIAIDIHQNIIIAGYFSGSNTIFGSTTLTNTASDNSADIFIAKYGEEQTSIEKVYQKDCIIKPMPVVNMATIISEEAVSSFELYSLTGLKILADNSGANEINTSGLLKGTYIIKIIFNNGATAAKVIIK